MGYLSVDAAALPNFTKAVISLWFRVPQASIDAAKAAFVVGVPIDGATGVPTGAAPPLNGIVPLITFGKVIDDAYEVDHIDGAETTFTTTNTFLSFCVVDHEISTTDTLFSPVSVKGTSYTLDPCYIGVDCSDDPIVLKVNFQMDDFAAVSGNWELTAQTAGPLHIPGGIAVEGCPGIGTGLMTIDPFLLTNFYTDEVFATSHTFTDVSALLYDARRESFGGSSPTIEIKADKWHHVVFSIDLTGAVNANGTISGGPINSMSSSCKMWIAVDDVNYQGDDMPTIKSWGQLSDPNTIVTPHAVDTFFASTGQPQPSSGIGDGFLSADTTSGLDSAPSYSYTPEPVPASTQPFGLPATAAFVDNIFKIEMAEFQMFTGVSMDTGVEANRRAFVARGADGSLIPVNPFAFQPPADPTAGVDPTTLLPVGPPIKLLGKPPDIAFTSSSFNWQAGINTGVVEEDGSRAAPFKPTGTIKPFLPNPVVGM